MTNKKTEASDTKQQDSETFMGRFSANCKNQNVINVNVNWKQYIWKIIFFSRKYTLQIVQVVENRSKSRKDRKISNPVASKSFL